MAPVVMAVAAVASAAMSYQSYKQQKKAASAAEDLAQQNAANKEAETREQAFRLKENQRRAMAELSAAAAATGFAGGTQDIYSSEMARTQKRELKWLEKSGAMQADIIRAGGAVARMEAEAGAMGALADTASSVGQAASASSSAYTWGKQQGYWGAS